MQRPPRLPLLPNFKSDISNHKSHEKCCFYSVGSFARLASFALVKKDAAQSPFRLFDSYKPNTGDLEGHLNIYR
jgi:hypothetical protein